MKFTIELPVQFRDIDRMGHVNHAVYLQYMETCRIELARRLGIITSVTGSSFIVGMAHVEYKKPITNERKITVSCWVSRIGDKSWDLDYMIRSGKVEFVIGRTTQVSYDYGRGSTVRISAKFRKKLQDYSGKPLNFRNTA